MKNKWVAIAVAVSLIAGCATQQLVVDPKTINDQAKFEQDKAECKTVSETYDQTGAVAGNSVMGAVAGAGCIYSDGVMSEAVFGVGLLLSDAAAQLACNQ